MPINNKAEGVADIINAFDDVVIQPQEIRVRKQPKIKEMNDDERFVFDYEKNEKIDLATVNVKMTKGIVGGSVDNLKFGYFSLNLAKNILVVVNDEVIYAISSDCLNEDSKFVFDNSIGYYKIFPKQHKYDKVMLANKGTGGYPYKITKFYNAEFQLDNFKGKQREVEFHNKYKGYLKYTFGIEFEASKGYLPQEKCFQLGLVPLRDGSISSVEYATVVMNESKLGLLKQQVEELKKYTDFNKECSLHMHLGGYPVTLKAVYMLFKVCKSLESYLYTSLPKYTFRTSLYKATKKDYCKMLPDCKTANAMYEYFADYRCRYAGSLTVNHPHDEEKRGKWNIQSRYVWLNLVNMLFYKECKTVEFRMLRPTLNFNKIIYWLYTFNAILLYAESLANKCKTIEDVERMDIPKLTLNDIFHGVYNKELATKMSINNDVDMYIICTQSSINDYIGKNVQFEDVMFTENILE